MRQLVHSFSSGTTVVGGGAEGVDEWAAREAEGIGLRVERFHPSNPTTAALLARTQAMIPTLDALHAFVWWGCRGTWFTIAQAKKHGVPLTIHPPEPNTVVWTSPLHAKDPHALDITRGSAHQHPPLRGRWAQLRGAALLRRTYHWAHAFEREGALLADVQARARREGAPFLGEPCAPSPALLHRALVEMRGAGKEKDLPFMRYRDGYPDGMPGFMAEFRARVKAEPLILGWLLARQKLILQCVCPSARAPICHRSLVAHALVKCGARYMGELGSSPEEPLFEGTRPPSRAS